MGNLSVVLIVVIAANVIISLKGFNDFSFFEKYKFHVGSILRESSLECSVVDFYMWT